MNIENKPKVLVRRRAALGDVIMTTGIVRELFKKYNGEVEISVITEHTTVFDNNPYVKKVYHTMRPMGGMVWDVEYNLDNAYELNPRNHFIDSYYQRVFGTTDMDKTVELFPAPHDRVKMQGIMSTLGDKFIVIHMRRWAWEHKNIKPEIWQEVINRALLEHSDLKIVIVGQGPDYNIKATDRITSLVDQLTIQQTKLLLEKALAFVGSDSAPYAVAGATDVPVIPLLSHLHPSHILPFRHGVMEFNTIPVIAKIDCVGCYNDQIRPISQVTCKYGDYRCNGLYDVSEVLQAISKAIKK